MRQGDEDGQIILPRLGVLVLLVVDPVRFAGERLCVCNSAQETDVALARKSGGEVITCGMSLRDSITFSSCAESRCVIGVQRSINRLDGSRAEPFELPADCTPQDDRYGILCAYLLLILAGFF